jgi:hypothetical protein
MLLFHIFNTETIDRSIVFKTIKTAAELFTGNLSNFRGIFNWTFEKVDFNINVHGDYKFYENFEIF